MATTWTDRLGGAALAISVLLAGCGRVPTAGGGALASAVSVRHVQDASGGPYRVIRPVGGNGEPIAPPASASSPARRLSGPESLKVTLLLRNGAITSAALPDKLKDRALALVTRMNALDTAHKRALTAEIYRKFSTLTLGQISQLMKQWAHQPAEALDFLDQAVTASSALSQHDIDSAMATLPEDVDVGYEVELSPPESR